MRGHDATQCLALPTGLLPSFVLALTVGVATLVTLGAHLSWSLGTHPFSVALRTAFVGPGVLGTGLAASAEPTPSLAGR
jgi:hypothetical protein